MFRNFVIRGWIAGEHVCAFAFAGLEFSESFHAILIAGSALLLAALSIAALFYFHDWLKEHCTWPR